MGSKSEQTDLVSRFSSGKVGQYRLAFITAAAIIVIYLILNALTQGRFLTGTNMLFVLTSSVVPTLIVLCFTFIFTMGITDLSAGAVMILASNAGGILALELGLGYFGLIVGSVVVAVSLQLLNLKIMLVSKLPSWIFGLGAIMVYEGIGALYSSHKISQGQQVVSLGKHYRGLGAPPWKKLHNEAAGLFERWGFHSFNTNRMTDTLSVEEKKIVELIRALSVDPDLLILDEITQALSFNYRRILLDIIRKLKADGKSILIVTHDVEEMLEITDSITIMRDGKVIKTLRSDSITPEEIKRLMVGRDLKGAYYREDEQESYDGQVVLSDRNLTTEHFEDVTFDLHKGEILGICGLSDAGIHELAETLFAVRKRIDGSVTVTRTGETVETPMQAMRLKMGYVPKDRDKQALMINDSIENNVSLPTVEIAKGRMGFLRPQRRRELSEQVIRQFEVKASGAGQLMNGLSGGNRQKVNLGRWMIQDKDILILDCPTRGVDVGVKSYIYHSMLLAKEKGVSMIVVSDELPELIGMSDTLLIMASGRVVKTIKRSSGFTEESIIEVML